MYKYRIIHVNDIQIHQLDLKEDNAHFSQLFYRNSSIAGENSVLYSDKAGVGG